MGVFCEMKRKPLIRLWTPVKRWGIKGAEALIRHAIKMQGFLAVLLFSGASIAACANPSVPPRQTYEQVLALAVDAFNQQSGEAYAFRLLEAEPAPDWVSSWAKGLGGWDGLSGVFGLPLQFSAHADNHKKESVICVTHINHSASR